MGYLIEQEMRAVVAAHNAECGARAEQMMVDGRLFPYQIEDWAEEVERLRAAIARHLEQAAQDDYNSIVWGEQANAVPWADLPEAERAVYRGAVAADFWREP